MSAQFTFRSREDPTTRSIVGQFAAAAAKSSYTVVTGDNPQHWRVRLRQNGEPHNNLNDYFTNIGIAFGPNGSTVLICTTVPPEDAEWLVQLLRPLVDMLVDVLLQAKCQANVIDFRSARSDRRMIVGSNSRAIMDRLQLATGTNYFLCIRMINLVVGEEFIRAFAAFGSSSRMKNIDLFIENCIFDNYALLGETFANNRSLERLTLTRSTGHVSDIDWMLPLLQCLKSSPALKSLDLSTKRLNGRFLSREVPVSIWTEILRLPIKILCLDQHLFDDILPGNFENLWDMLSKHASIRSILFSFGERVPRGTVSNVAVVQAAIRANPRIVEIESLPEECYRIVEPLLKKNQLAAKIEKTFDLASNVQEDRLLELLIDERDSLTGLFQILSSNTVDIWIRNCFQSATMSRKRARDDNNA